MLNINCMKKCDKDNFRQVLLKCPQNVNKTIQFQISSPSTRIFVNPHTVFVSLLIFSWQCHTINANLCCFRFVSTREKCAMKMTLLILNFFSSLFDSMMKMSQIAQYRWFLFCTIFFCCVQKVGRKKSTS